VLPRSTAVSRYHGVVRADGSDSLSSLARSIRPAANVLDIGCGEGALGTFLAHSAGCRVDGVDRDFDALRSARTYRRLVLADLDRSLPSELFPQHVYDYVVFADVLEHLHDPARTLADAVRLLAPGGHILISAPNATYGPLVAELLHGRLEYRDNGLLDRSHVRLLTRQSLLQMVADSGLLETAAVDTITRSPALSEFDVRYLEALPPAVLAFLETNPDVYTYQYLIDCVRAQTAQTDQHIAQPAPRSVLPRFCSRLFWRAPGASFGPECSVTTIGIAGEGQILRFDLPGTQVAGLLLEPCDRPAVLVLRGIKVSGDSGPIWTWDGDDTLLAAFRERVILLRSENLLRAVITGREPRLHLPVPEEALTNASGPVTVEIRLDWTLSTDSQIVLERLSHRFQELDDAYARVAALISEREALATLLDDRLRTLNRTEGAWIEAVQERDLALTFLAEHRQTLSEVQARLNALEERIMTITATIHDTTASVEAPAVRPDSRT